MCENENMQWKNKGKKQQLRSSQTFFADTIMHSLHYEYTITHPDAYLQCVVASPTA